MNRYPIQWSHGEAEVLSTAAVLADCRFDVGGRDFRPFARAPWMGTIDDTNIIGHLRELGGDFVCVPFGAGFGGPTGPKAWADLMTDPPLLPVHGPAGDEEWTLVEQTASSVTLALDYPNDHPVRRLERMVSGRNGQPVLDNVLVIHPRHATDISVGLHPILKLPEQQGRLLLEADFAFGLVHPRQSDETTAEFTALDKVVLPDGATDLSHVPLGRPNTSVQLCGMRGPMAAHYLDEGMSLEIDWDRAILPSLQIWCTDRGIDGPPWHGRYRGIGLEPIASAFDLNSNLSARANPINQRGIATSVALTPDRPITIKHSFRAFKTEN